MSPVQQSSRTMENLYVATSDDIVVAYTERHIVRVHFDKYIFCDNGLFVGDDTIIGTHSGDLTSEICQFYDFMDEPSESIHDVVAFYLQEEAKRGRDSVLYSNATRFVCDENRTPTISDSELAQIRRLSLRLAAAGQIAFGRGIVHIYNANNDPRASAHKDDLSTLHLPGLRHGRRSRNEHHHVTTFIGSGETSARESLAAAAQAHTIMEGAYMERPNR